MTQRVPGFFWFYIVSHIALVTMGKCGLSAPQPRLPWSLLGGGMIRLRNVLSASDQPDSRGRFRRTSGWAGERRSCWEWRWSQRPYQRYSITPLSGNSALFSIMSRSFLNVNNVKKTPWKFRFVVTFRGLSNYSQMLNREGSLNYNSVCFFAA